MENERHLNHVLLPFIKWPNKFPAENLIGFVLQRIPTQNIGLYDSMNVKAYFKRRSGKIFEGNYTLLADCKKWSWYCVDFEVHEAEQKWQTGRHADTSYPITVNIGDELTFKLDGFISDMPGMPVDPMCFCLPPSAGKYLTATGSLIITKEEALAIHLATLSDRDLPIHLRYKESQEEYEVCAAIRDEIEKRKAAN